jgi:hypothetical protein
MKNINTRAYITYKLLNSLYAGAAMGSVFIIYASLPPSLFSFGGIVLALGGWVIAFYYVRLVRFGTFFSVGLSVEVATFMMTLMFLVFNTSAWIAFFIYSVYQFIFLFGNYLVRAETKLFAKTALFSIFDRAKQIGYLAGLGFSFIFYELLGYYGNKSSYSQIFYLYFGLLSIQAVVLFVYLRAFKKI